jgi:D-glucuronyl C5-epimerase C-terminus
MVRSARPPRLLSAVLVAVIGSMSATGGATATETDEPPPYHLRHFDVRDLPFDRLPWTNAPPPALPALPPADARGIRMFRWIDGHYYYRPGSVAINGMKRLDAYRDTGDRAQLEQALVEARHLRSMHVEDEDAWWLPFWFDYPPAGLSAPWYNAMSQGLALSFFVRLHRVTGDDIHLRAAERIFESFRRLGRKKGGSGRPWVAYVADGGYLWLEHYPNALPDHVLNAHLHAVIGLYEYWQHTRSPEARQLLEGALTTMRDRAASYRREGRVSIYGLRSRTNHYKYHQVHIWQLRLLGRMTGDQFFTSLGNAMAADRGPKRDVQGRPAVSSPGIVLNPAPLASHIAPYPPVAPDLAAA